MSDPVFVTTAWNAIGFDDGQFRIKGGKALYQAVIYNCETGGRLVRLSRLDNRLHETTRYVEPDTILEFMEVTSEGMKFLEWQKSLTS